LQIELVQVIKVDIESESDDDDDEYAVEEWERIRFKFEQPSNSADLLRNWLVALDDLILAPLIVTDLEVFDDRSSVGNDQNRREKEHVHLV
jgi:hypothetical protein